LEEAYPVRFHAREAGALGELDAIVAFGVEDTEAPGMPSLILHSEERTVGAPRPLALANDPVLARPLRGALLTDAYAIALQTVGSRERVLAELARAPAWVLDARGGGAMSQRVACAPAELGPSEALRERLRPGRSLALLALVHFLACLTAHLRPSPPPLQAAFVIDDPNLRRPRYGYLNYASLLRHARLHGYHLAVAMVPLDARLAHPRATRIFHEGGEQLSLCIHGNDHDGPELGRPRSDAEALPLIAQALRRTAAFERRTGVPVDRVMVPPHERLSEPVARALRAYSFQAVTTTRPYPWIADTIKRPWLDRPSDAGPLAAWRPIDRVAGGLPILLRADFRLHPREDLVLRAFLGQPLILYGHHDLLAEGPDGFAEAAAQINRLGDVSWSSLAAIAHAHTHMQPHPLDRSPADRPLDIHAYCTGSSPSALPVRRSRLRPLLHRLASEGRDRAAAIYAR
jgi:hypothetical protein